MEVDKIWVPLHPCSKSKIFVILGNLNDLKIGIKKTNKETNKAHVMHSFIVKLRTMVTRVIA